MKPKSILTRIEEIVASTSDVSIAFEKVEGLISEIRAQHPPRVAKEAETAIRNLMKNYASLSARGDA